MDGIKFNNMKPDSRSTDSGQIICEISIPWDFQLEILTEKQSYPIERSTLFNFPLRIYPVTSHCYLSHCLVIILSVRGSYHEAGPYQLSLNTAVMQSSSSGLITVHLYRRVR